MNEFATKWIEELRSGNYMQGNGTLRREDTYCCLGVLCDVVDPRHWVDSIDGSYRFTYLGHSAIPDDQTLEKVGMNANQARFLSSMNDSGKSFDYIAIKIEEMLK